MGGDISLLDCFLADKMGRIKAKLKIKNEK